MNMLWNGFIVKTNGGDKLIVFWGNEEDTCHCPPGEGSQASYHQHALVWTKNQTPVAHISLIWTHLLTKSTALQQGWKTPRGKGKGTGFRHISLQTEKVFGESFLIPAGINPGSKRIASTRLGYRAKHTCLAFTIHKIRITHLLPLHGGENEWERMTVCQY